MTAPERSTRAGFAAAASAYTFWGLMPLYLHLVAFASPWEVVCARILFSMPAAMALVALMGGFAETRAALAQRGVMAALVLSAVCIAANWGIYVWAVAHQHVIEASLAYFLTPLVNVAFGVTLFGERLTRLQAGALLLAAGGIAVQGAALGAFPWVALALCASWSVYGLVRKRAPAPAAGGLLAETLVLAPVATLGLWFLSRTQGGLAIDDSPGNALLLAASGLVTAVPLILFSFGARRLRFTTLGMLQFVSPTIQFAIGWAQGEPMSPLRAASFALIWVGLALFTADALWRERRRAPA